MTYSNSQRHTSMHTNAITTTGCSTVAPVWEPCMAMCFSADHVTCPEGMRTLCEVDLSGSTMAYGEGQMG